VFFLFGLVYKHLMRHMPAPPRIRFLPKWIR
jgi:polar amino acid transport system permease protein